MFFLKAIILLLALLAIATIINRCTVYYGDRGRVLNTTAVIACVIITVAVTVLLPSIVFTRAQATTQVSAEAIIRPIEDYFTEFEEIRIDISHLPNGSNIEVQIADRSVMANVVTGASFFSSAPVSISERESLRNIQGDTLIVSYRPPFFQVDGMMLSDFADTQLIAYLEGNVLFIDNIIDNVQVVILPIWGMARQFDFFSDRNIFRESMIGFSAGGDITANVWLRVE